MFRRRISSESRAEPSICSPYNIGVNAIFLPLFPYAVVTGLHDTHLRLALIIGTALSGGITIIGIVFRFTGGYRTWPFLFELFMLVVNAVLLGVSYPEPSVVARYLPFISNAFYATFCLVSIMLAAPFTLQYVREFVPPAAASHDKLVRAAYATASVWTITFVTNTLIYLIPICRSKEWDHMNVLNLLFRIILPCFFAAFAAIFTRVWPARVLQHLINSAGFDSTVRKVVVNPLAFPPGTGPLPPALYAPVPVLQAPAVQVKTVTP